MADWSAYQAREASLRSQLTPSGIKGVDSSGLNESLKTVNEGGKQFFEGMEKAKNNAEMENFWKQFQEGEAKNKAQLDENLNQATNEFNAANDKIAKQRQDVAAATYYNSLTDEEKSMIGDQAMTTGKDITELMLDHIDNKSQQLDQAINSMSSKSLENNAFSLLAQKDDLNAKMTYVNGGTTADNNSTQQAYDYLYEKWVDKKVNEANLQSQSLQKEKENITNAYKNMGFDPQNSHDVQNLRALLVDFNQLSADQLAAKYGGLGIEAANGQLTQESQDFINNARALDDAMVKHQLNYHQNQADLANSLLGQLSFSAYKSNREIINSLLKYSDPNNLAIQEKLVTDDRISKEYANNSADPTKSKQNNGEAQETESMSKQKNTSSKNNQTQGQKQSQQQQLDKAMEETNSSTPPEDTTIQDLNQASANEQKNMEKSVFDNVNDLFETMKTGIKDDPLMDSEDISAIKWDRYMENRQNYDLATLEELPEGKSFNEQSNKLTTSIENIQKGIERIRNNPNGVSVSDINELLLQIDNFTDTSNVNKAHTDFFKQYAPQIAATKAQLIQLQISKTKTETMNNGTTLKTNGDGSYQVTSKDGTRSQTLPPTQTAIDILDSKVSHNAMLFFTNNVGETYRLKLEDTKDGKKVVGEKLDFGKKSSKVPDSEYAQKNYTKALIFGKTFGANEDTQTALFILADAMSSIKRDIDGLSLEDYANGLNKNMSTTALQKDLQEAVEKMAKEYGYDNTKQLYQSISQFMPKTSSEHLDTQENWAHVAIMFNMLYRNNVNVAIANSTNDNSNLNGTIFNTPNIIRSLNGGSEIEKSLVPFGKTQKR